MGYLITEQYWQWAVDNGGGILGYRRGQRQWVRERQNLFRVIGYTEMLPEDYINISLDALRLVCQQRPERHFRAVILNRSAEPGAVSTDDSLIMNVQKVEDSKLIKVIAQSENTLLSEVELETSQ